MAVDTAALEIKVAAGKLDEATKKLDKFTSTAQKTEKATDSLSASFKNMVGPVVALVSVTELARKLITVTREFDVLNAGLITATKSAENAATAFEALQEFAQKTPYDLKQAVAGFTQLVNLGLTPSEKALTSYGNTASAMGKSLEQMIGAVADAATGEFERLKEFGIKAKIEGDNVAFIFQGVKTSVKNNAAEIEKYLMALGENQFAGAMERRMATLDGSIANLADQWDALFLNVSKSGVGDIIKENVDLASDALEELNTMLKSGQIDAYLEASKLGWAGWGQDVEETINILGKAINYAFDAWGKDAAGAGKSMYLGFAEFPVEVRAYFKEAAVEVDSFVDEVKAQAAFVKQAFANIVDDPMGTKALDDLSQEMDRIAASRAERIAGVNEEKVSVIDAMNQEIDRGKALRDEYDQQIEARRKLNEDRLAQYKVGGEGGSAGTDLSKAEQSKADAKAKQQKKEFESLVESLNTEEEAINVSYEKRRAIIEKNTTAESASRANLMERLNKDRQKELDDLRGIESALEKRKRLLLELGEIEQSTWTESQVALDKYQKQMETLWQAQQAGLLSESGHEEAVRKVTLAYEEQATVAEEGFFDMSEFGKQAAHNIQDEFAEFLFDPFQQGIDGMLLGFVKVVQRMAAEAAAAQLSSALFGSAGGGSGSGWIGQLIGFGASFFGGGGATASATAGAAQAGASSFASQFDASAGGVSFPGRASGGPTVGGQMYEVGERGPELYQRGGRSFLLDSQAGSVTPASAGPQSASGISINQVFNIDNRGNETGGTEDAGNSQGNKLGQIMKSTALQVIQEEQRPGGILWSQEANRNG